MADIMARTSDMAATEVTEARTTDMPARRVGMADIMARRSDMAITEAMEDTVGIPVTEDMVERR
jgi:hypothetical protein